MADELRGIEKLLATRIGLDPIAVGLPLILRASRRRMKELGLEDLGEYERRLSQSELELQELIEEVVVPESWFFRDERPFHWLRDYVRERWLTDLSRPPLRVLSLPCAGGEEPYSITLTLLDLGLPARRFRIDAVDVSLKRLTIARRGVYSANAFRGPDLSYRARSFREHPQGYELDPTVRATVRFIQASVLDPRLLEGSPPYDVLFCRNLLIYLDASARANVLAAIDRLLAADGVLFIGHADRLNWAGAEPRFTAVGDPGCFAYQRGARGRVRVNPPQPQLGPPPSMLSLIVPSDVSDGEEATPPVEPRAIFPRTDDSARIVEDLSLPVVSPLSFLDRAAALANLGRFDEAIAACERHLQQKGPSAAAYYLLGMICQAAGARPRAEECFKKTVYLDPRHDEALLALALLAERRGDHNAAAGFRRRAERIATMTGVEGERK
jgi:chemotaxis protein methyltransferase WspC